MGTKLVRDWAKVVRQVIGQHDGNKFSRRLAGQQVCVYYWAMGSMLGMTLGALVFGATHIRLEGLVGK